MHTRNRVRGLFIVMLAATVLTAGCRKKLTFERWESLPVGETKANVKSTLGKPLEDRGTRMTYANQDQGIAADTWFDPQTGRLTYSQWADPVHGIREKGTRPAR